MLIVLKSGSLDLLKPSGPVQACSGIALHFYCSSLRLPELQFRFSSFSARLLSTVQRRTALNMYWRRADINRNISRLHYSSFGFIYLFTTWTVASLRGPMLQSRTNTQLWRRKLPNTLLLGVRLPRWTQQAVGRRTDCPLQQYHCPTSCIFTNLWHQHEPCSAKVAQHSSCEVLP